MMRGLFRRHASGTHFFFEESAGVTVYVYDGVGYKKQTFLKGVRLDAAMRWPWKRRVQAPPTVPEA